MTDVSDRIDTMIKEHAVVLFMKGTRGAPQCGFSARVVSILDDALPEYATVNVLADPDVRAGIKEFSSWPTIPQLYVSGKFVGGCDIITEMNQSGELDEVLGVKREPVAAPEVTLTEAAMKAFLEFHDGPGEPTVRVQINAAFEYGMDFDQESPGDLVVATQGLTLVFDRASARRGDGMTIDFVKGPGGEGFKIDNPQEPPKVRAVVPAQLKEWFDEGKPMEVFDVRSNEERALAQLGESHQLDDAGKARLESLDRDTVVVFFCHHGMRSQAAAQHALRMGFHQVFNLAGGIDAWSRAIDPSVARY